MTRLSLEIYIVRIIWIAFDLSKRSNDRWDSEWWFTEHLLQYRYYDCFNI